MHALADIPPIRSKGVLAHSRGQHCTLRFPGVCSRNPATTVPCHIRDRHKGMGRKSSDSSFVFGCHACHDVLDGRRPWPEPAPSEATIWKTIVRAMQETLEILIFDKVIIWPVDVERPKRTAPPKPKEKSTKPKRAIPSRKMRWQKP